MKRDISNLLKCVTAIAPSVATADANGATFDKASDPGFEALMLVAILGASGDTLSGSVKVQLEMEESDDNSVWTKVANADMEVPDPTQLGTDGLGIFQTIDDAAEDEAVYKAGYKGDKRYCRIVRNMIGTHTNGIPFAALYVAGEALAEPVA